MLTMAGSGSGEREWRWSCCEPRSSVPVNNDKLGSRPREGCAPVSIFYARSLYVSLSPDGVRTQSTGG